ncbi:MAG: serine/threonine-protein kinase [Gemmataceae bacterium]
MPDGKGQRRGVDATSESNRPSPPSHTALPGGKTPLSGEAGWPKSTAEPPAELVALSKFQFLEKIGEGGMGAVWKANHNFLDRPVAIKVMSGAAVGHAEARERFLAEMRAGGRLHHPNVAQTIDAAQAGDTLFLVMEFVDGASLDRVVMKKGPLPAVLACRCVQQAALGLQHAHEKGMAHRDVKPANLMVARDGTVKVLDFGLARLPVEQGETRKTRYQAFMGTADYVSPEQAKDARTADTRSDIYSLGCTLFFLLAGRPPFEGESVLEVAAKHVTDELEPLPNLPEGLWAVLAKMTAKDPRQRYQTPAQVVEAMQPFAEKREPAGRSGAYVAPPPPLPHPPRRKAPWLVAAGAAAVLAAAALTALLTMNPSIPGPVALDKTSGNTEARPTPEPAPAEAPPPETKEVASNDPPAPKVDPPEKDDLTPPKDDPPPKEDAATPKPPADGPDKVLERLDKAKADFQAASDRLRERLLESLQAEEKDSEAKGYTRTVALLREERELFKSAGTLPKLPGLKPAVEDYKSGLARARRALELAYADAGRDYRAAGQPEKADGVATEQGELQKAPPAARPVVRKEPVVIAEWEQTVHPGKNKPFTTTVRWYSNGRLNSPTGEATWRRLGNMVYYHWPNPKAPGGAWIDALVLSADERRYAGKNNNNKLPTRITGTRTK